MSTSATQLPTPTTTPPRNISPLGKATSLDAQTRAEIFGGVAATLKALEAEEKREEAKECGIYGIDTRMEPGRRWRKLEEARAAAEFDRKEAMRIMALQNRYNAALPAKVV